MAALSAASPSAPESSDALTVSVAEEIGEQTGGVDRQPVASPANVPPVYPRDALRRHQFGTVVLLLTIDVDGRVFAVEVATSSGVRSLDAAAREAALRWRFASGLEDGQPARCELSVPVEFVLSGG